MADVDAAHEDMGQAATRAPPSATPGPGNYLGASRPSRTPGEVRSAEGELIVNKIPAANFLAWWHGGLLRETVDHDWDASASKGTPCRQAVARENIAYNQPPPPSFLHRGWVWTCRRSRTSPTAGGAVPVADMCQIRPPGTQRLSKIAA